MTPELRKAFAANRRPVKSPGYWRPASLALQWARKWLERMAEAEAAKTAAYAAMNAARAVDSRQYAPGMIAARDQLAKAESLWSTAYASTAQAWPLKGNDSALGAAFAIGDRGARGPFGRWCENPPFRFVGLAHEVASLDHTGWYSEPGGDGDLIRGAVYQLTARDGRARYIPSIADPNNDGAAILALGEVETAGDSSEESAEDARKDAARRADQLAEYYAEAERDYREAYNQGAAARAKAAEATQAAKSWARAGRAVRGLYAERHALGNALARGVMAQLILQAREACDALTTARKAAAKARRDCPSWKAEAWRDGYAEGQL